MLKTLAILFLCCWGAFAANSGEPDFSGTWVLDLAASDLGPMPAPRAMTLVIQHHDPDLKVTTSITGGPQGDLNYQATYRTDGKETINRLEGHDAHCTATWEGDSLVLRTKADFGAGSVLIQSHWSLLRGGKILQQSAHVSTPQGSFDPSYVFDRETIR